MKRYPTFVIAVTVLFGGVVSIVVIFVSRILVPQNVWQVQNIIDPSTYQAVFLDNNQTYFGHLKDVSLGYLVLSDVYYVQLEEVIQKKNTPARAPTGRLVKLGATEPHGPRNEMTLNKGHVLFWENLKPDSPIIKTIQSMNAQTK